MTAVDMDAQKVDAINRGIAPVHEPGLPELMQESEGRLSATADTEAAVRGSEATFIVVNTPSEAGRGILAAIRAPRLGGHWEDAAHQDRDFTWWC